MDDNTAAPASDPADPKQQEFIVGQWLDLISAADKDEKDWRDDADKAVDAYKGEADSVSKRFNIVHSSIETICPAIYNSTPTPDVRRRYDAADPIGKAVADILERALSYAVESYDFDETMNATVKDAVMVDRGVARVRYVPSFGPDGTMAYQEALCEHVPWRSFRRGAARTWSAVPWIAFEHFLSRETLASKVAPEVLKDIPFTYSGSAKDDKGDKAAVTAGARARAWEIWNKDKREVLFICPDYGKAPLWTVPDPLGLRGFFPVPRPVQPIAVTDSLVPITGLSIYEDLVVELNEIQRRITKLVQQLRARGGYAGIGDEIKQIAEADDGELVPLTSAEMFASQGGGIEKAITWFPLEPIVGALVQLVSQREQIKQLIFEVSGLADVMRGQVDPNEKLGQTQIKAQWGGLRVQRLQAEAARFARDLFRLKAEVIASKFTMDNLRLMTGLDYPPAQQRDQVRQQLAMAQQQPGTKPDIKTEELAAQASLEEVEQLLRSDILRQYRIDIESDSTLRGDLQRNQQQMAMFLQGTAQFAQAVGPLIAQKAMPPDVAIEIYAAFARQYKLGKQAEDALDSWADRVKKEVAKPDEPDPAQQIAERGAMAKVAESEAGAGLKQAQAQETQVNTQVAAAQLAMPPMPMQGADGVPGGVPDQGGMMPMPPQ